jgi:type III restriction enzyme
MVAATISRVLASRMIDGIKYEKIADDYYEMRLFEDGEVEQYIENLYIVKQQQKTLYNCITIDSMSEVERKFAEDCDSREDVEFYFKLPRGFVIPTPIGNYTPDWAIVFKDEKRLYFVAETKGSLNYDDLRHSESQKIRCGYRHFEEFKDQEVRFKHVTDLRELR